MKTTLPHLAVFAALTNALVWGLSWMPLRWLEARGISPLWTTTCVFGLCAASVAIAWPAAVREFVSHRSLIWLSLAAAFTNIFFNAALVMGDVVRAVLLFYLMPIWVVFLARWLLREGFTLLAFVRIAIALIGAALVLGQGALVLPIPRSFPDTLAVAGGFMFGLNNVLLRKFSAIDESARAFAIFIGAVVLPPFAIVALSALGYANPIPAAQFSAWLGLGAFAIAVGVANLALQFGAARLRANTLSLIMISEVLFAAGSSVLFGDSKFTAWTLAGGVLIVAASLLAIVQPRKSRM